VVQAQPEAEKAKLYESAYGVLIPRAVEARGRMRREGRAMNQQFRKQPRWWAALVGLSGPLFALACQTQAQFLASRQDKALETALTRARFEMNCPDAKGEVLSSEVTQPAVQGPYVAGVERGEFTIGVTGCGQRNTYIVACPEGGEGCFALDSRGLPNR